MASNSAFRVNVGDLLGSDLRVRQHRLVVPVDWKVELSQIADDPPLEADLELTATSGGIVVRGVVSATVVNTCARCLRESVQPLRVAITQIVERDSEDEDAYRLEGQELDLEPVVRDEVLLAVPLRPQCQPGCEGLVRDTESDLNTSSPASAERPDSPFAALQDLFEAREMNS